MGLFTDAMKESKGKGLLTGKKPKARSKGLLSRKGKGLLTGKVKSKGLLTGPR